jgi:hypothetical protein
MLWSEGPDEGPGDAMDVIGGQLLCAALAAGLEAALTGSLLCCILVDVLSEDDLFSLDG